MDAVVSELRHRGTVHVSEAGALTETVVWDDYEQEDVEQNIWV